jgi:predicted phage terminase large subunit-like protein
LKLKNFSPEQRTQFAKSNLRYFASYLGYQNTAYFQDEWYNLLQPQNDPEHFSPLQWHPKALKKYHLEAPRKHAKSECTAINYPSWLIGNYPNIHILIVSKTSDLAEATVAAIKARIETDEKYHAVFGDLKPKSPQKWTDQQFIVKRKEISKFPTLRGCGLMGALTGGGNDLIIADDIIDEENVNTRLQLEKASRWFFKVLLTTMFPWGACFAIGTRWHYADLYAELLKKWKHQIYKAILNEKEIVEGKPPEVLWPKVWSYQRLMEKQDDIGCQYQNDPTGMEGSLLKAKWLTPWDKTPPSWCEYYAGLDPSLGEHDYFGIATLAYDRKNNQRYLVDVWAEHLPFPDIMKTKIPLLHAQYKYVKMYMETNFWQKLLMDMPELRGLPMVGVKTVRDKTSRFITMSSHFEAERVLVNPLLLRNSEFWTEWVQYPRGQHDDALDATEIVVNKVVKPRAKKPSFYLIGSTA